MKSFAKTFRTFLAMSLVLCMVMSCVTVSAGGTVTLDGPTEAVTTKTDGYYQVQYTVGGISEGGSATILVYDKGEDISNTTIEYANQAIVDEEDGNGTYQKTFTMLLGNGSYEVKAGGTGYLLAATDEVVTGSAPTITNVVAVPDLTDANTAETGVTVATFEVDDVDNTEDESNIASVAITTGDTESFEVNAACTAIVTKKAVDKGEYPLTITVTDKQGLTATAEVTIVVESSVTSVKLGSDAEGIVAEVAYGAEGEEGTPVFPVTSLKLYDTNGAVIENVTVAITDWTAPEGYNTTEEKAWEFTAVLGDLSADYAWEGGVAPTVTATATVVDSRKEVTVVCNADVTVDWAQEYTDPAVTYTVGGETEEIADAKVQWEGEKVDSTDDSKKYTRTATITLPADGDYRIAGTHATETTVTVTVTVNDNRDEITSVELEKAYENVVYGGDMPELPTKAIGKIGATNKEVELDLIAIGWDEDFDSNKENGEFKWTATASIPEDKANEYKFAETLTDKTVTLTVKIGERTKITAVTVGKTEYTVDFGTDIAADDDMTLPKSYVATVENADTVDVSVAWNYKDFNKDVPASYTITGTLTAPEGYKFETPELATVTVTVTVDKKVINKANVVVDPATINVEYGKTPDFSNVTAKAFENVELTIDANAWKCTAEDGFDAEKPGDYTFTNTVALTEEQDATYKFANEADATVTVTVVVAKPSYVIDKYEFVDDEDNVVTEVEVNKSTNWDAALDLFPLYIKLYSGDLSMIAEVPGGAWINHNKEEDGFPPAEWTSEDFEVDKSEIILEAYWKWGEGATNPKITVTTKGTPSADAFVVKADGYNKKYVASRIGAESVITVEPAVEGGTIAGAKAYAFEISDETSTTKVDFSESNTTTIKVPETLETNGTRYTVTATVQYEDGSELSKTIYVTKYPSVFSGSVYINDYVLDEDGKVQAADTGYSAVRSNRNRDLVVSYKYVNANGEAMNGSATLYIYHVDDVNNPEAVPTTYKFTNGETSLVIPAEDVQKFAAKDGEYKFYVEYKDAADSDSEADKAKAERIGGLKNRKGTYISNNGTWYSKFAINDMSRSGIIIRRNEKLINDVELTELGADGKAYVGYNLLKWGTAYDEAAKEKEKFEEEPVTTKSYQHSFDVESAEIEATNAAYTFYSLVRLDGINQGYDDMKASRTVYLYNRYTSVCNLNMQNSPINTSGPVADPDGTITFKAYWSNPGYKNLFNYETITYKLIFESGLSDVGLENAVSEGAEIENGNTVVFTENKGGDTATVKINISAFTSKVSAKLEVYIDNDTEPDTTIPKVFWPKKAQ